MSQKKLLSQLAVVATLMTVSPLALATKARLLGLNEESTGSMFVRDARNMFQNPAYIHMAKDSIITEFGARGGTTPFYNDTDSNPQAEGGLVKAQGDYVYGIYLGGETKYTNESRGYTYGQSYDIHQDNQVDIFFGGGEEWKWALNLTGSEGKDETAGDNSQKSLSLRAGAIHDNYEFFANVSLINEAEVVTTTSRSEFDGKLGFELGATLRHDALSPFIYWRHAGWDQESNAALTNAPGTPGSLAKASADGSSNKFLLGVGREHKVSQTFTIFSRANLDVDLRKLEIAGTDLKINTYKIPVMVGFEAEATSWMTLRTSVSQNLWSKLDNENINNTSAATISTAFVKNQFKDGEKTIANSTNVNTGITLTFGGLSIDGMIGASTGSLTAENGKLNLDTLTTRTAVTYKF